MSNYPCKPQKPIVNYVKPSKWPSVLIGLSLSLFISAILTSNFTSRIVTNPLSSVSSSMLSLSPQSKPTSSSYTFTNNFLILLLGNTAHSNTEYDASSPSAPPKPQPDAHHLLSQSSITTSEDYPYEVKTDFLIDESDTNIEQTQDNHDKTSTSVSNSHANQTQSNSEQASSSSQLASVSSLSDTTQSSGQSEYDVISKLEPTQTTSFNLNLSSLYPDMSNQYSTCDISIGKWVEDPAYPLYSIDSCPFIDESFRCHENGRPDVRYTKWRWAPRECNLPRFNGTIFLELMRGKRVVFVGDSLNRNQWESLMCMLREALPDKTRILQIQGGHISKLPGAYAFKFLDYDCTVEFYTSQYLVEKQEGYTNQTRFTIRLDRMDKAERRWRKAHVLVFNTAHWWTPDKIGDGENCFIEGDTMYSKLDTMEAYAKALQTWARWMSKHINPNKTRVFFRGYSPIHYIGGQWNSGGQCLNESEPIYEESYLTPYPDNMKALDSVLKGLKVPVHVLNITRISDYRKDAHPAIYGHPLGQVVLHQDCSHWCLPGVPDIWNEILYFAILGTQQSIVPST